MERRIRGGQRLFPSQRRFWKGLFDQHESNLCVSKTVRHNNDTQQENDSCGCGGQNARKEQRRRRCRSVSFDKLEIHGFSKVLGDNPCADGLPVKLESNPPIYKMILRIDEYESYRPQRRIGDELRLSSLERETYLLATGHKYTDLVQAKKQNEQSKQEQSRSGQIEIEAVDTTIEAVTRSVFWEIIWSCRTIMFHNVWPKFNIRLLQSEVNTTLSIFAFVLVLYLIAEYLRTNDQGFFFS